MANKSDPLSLRCMPAGSQHEPVGHSPEDLIDLNVDSASISSSPSNATLHSPESLLLPVEGTSGALSCSATSRPSTAKTSGDKDHDHLYQNARPRGKPIHVTPSSVNMSHSRVIRVIADADQHKDYLSAATHLRQSPHHAVTPNDPVDPDVTRLDSTLPAVERCRIAIDAIMASVDGLIQKDDAPHRDGRTIEGATRRRTIIFHDDIVLTPAPLSYKAACHEGLGVPPHPVAEVRGGGSLANPSPTRDAPDSDTPLKGQRAAHKGKMTPMRAPYDHSAPLQPTEYYKALFRARMAACDERSARIDLEAPIEGARAAAALLERQLKAREEFYEHGTVNVTWRNVWEATLVCLFASL
ncbi:hypothetical protein CALVIDRAFT_602784 [Calocera viscosa TUFC12733]|uniref:Uncharacterized protein n=1 Tax=Calocera viscosa (strain TUFC12733) TaxID=1330018 RepID=A0A167GJD6_CALVF|nr:hypothetical protein CALVIDRAFT_602784 [Calocera viscosa TUFC12733]